MEPTPNALIARLNFDEAQKLADYGSILQDLRAVSEICTRLKGFLADASQDPTMIEALWTAALVRYARCFTSSKRVRLGDEVFVGLEGDPRDTHQFYFNLRNKLITHSVNPFEQMVVGAVLDKSSPEVRQLLGVASLSVKLVSSSIEGVDTLGRLATAVAQKVSASAATLHATVLEKARRLPIENLYEGAEMTFVTPGPDDAKRPR